MFISKMSEFKKFRSARPTTLTYGQTVDMSVVRAVLNEPDPEDIARGHWLHWVTEDECMVILYKLGKPVYEGTKLEAALDRHTKLLPMWRTFRHPIPVEQPDWANVSPAAKAVLAKLGVKHD